MYRATGYRITIPADWKVLCQGCGEPISVPRGTFTKNVWVRPRQGSLKAYHDNETCPPSLRDAATRIPETITEE